MKKLSEYCAYGEENAFKQIVFIAASFLIINLFLLTTTAYGGKTVFGLKKSPVNCAARIQSRKSQ